MKSLNIKFPFTINDLLNYFDLLGKQDLQRLSEKITNLLADKNNTNPENEEKELLAIVTNKLPAAFLNRFESLKLKMQLGKLETMEKLEMEAYVEKIEEFDTQKIIALNKLAKLKKIPFQQLAKDLNVFPRNNE